MVSLNLIKNKLWIIVLLLVPGMIKAQDFEGIVTYDITIQFSEGEIDSALTAIEYEVVMTATEYFRGNHHKSITRDVNLDFEMVSQFDPKTNVIYGYSMAKPSHGYKYVPKPAKEFTVTAVADLYILGKLCRGLRFQSETADVTYWYSDSYVLDRSRYQNKLDSFFSEFINRTGCLPLKQAYLVSPGQYNVATATRVKEKQLSDKIFKLPKFKELTESYE